MSALFHGSWMDNGEYAAEGIQNLERMKREVQCAHLRKVVLACKLTIEGSVPAILDRLEPEPSVVVNLIRNVCLAQSRLTHEARFQKRHVPGVQL